MRATAEERFHSKYVKGAECWEWTASRNAKGYGSFWDGVSMTTAHRYMARLVYGDLGDMHVLHTCDNPPCVNPEHLKLGTNLDNVADRVAKGHHPPPRTHCHRGASTVGRQRACLRQRHSLRESRVPDVLERAKCQLAHVLQAEGRIVTDYLDEIQARADAATDGPWRPAALDIVDGFAGRGGIYYQDTLPLLLTTSGATVANLQFIAHARTDVPRLVAEQRDLIRLLDAAREDKTKARRQRSEYRLRAMRAEAALRAVEALCAEARAGLSIPPIDCTGSCSDGPCDCSGVFRVRAWDLDPDRIRTAIRDALDPA